ncbi:hypothetical protein CLAIMM_13680 [Cladophialophora immunda]|nr:hypothetical protein CLAIMM_13680 [Cladophialophora immunda]
MSNPSSENPELELTDELRREFLEFRARMDHWDFDRSTGESPWQEMGRFWSRKKELLRWNWDQDPKEPGSTAFIEEQSYARLMASRLIPTDFCEWIKHIDIWDPKQVDDMELNIHHTFERPSNNSLDDDPNRDKTPIIPFPLFKCGNRYFYFDQCRDKGQEYRWWPWFAESRDDETEYDETEDKITNARWIKFDPPITIPRHLQKPEDTEHSSSLSYGLRVSQICSGVRDDMDGYSPWQWLWPIPFDILLHPADKSFWIVFDPDPDIDMVEAENGGREYYLRTYDDSGVWRRIGSEDPVAVWRLSLSDMQSIAQRRSYAGGRVSKVNPEDKESPRPQVIVDGRDPIWNSWDDARPERYSATVRGLKKYRDKLLQSGVLAGEDSNDPRTLQTGPSDPPTN